VKPAVAIAILVIFAVVLTTWITWRIGKGMAASEQARALLAGDQQYRALADEYRRLSDMAITAQEHSDLRLADLAVQMDALREKLEQMQRILSEVE
jgi:hypothetical protein